MTEFPLPSMVLVATALVGVLVAGEIAHRWLGAAPELSRTLDHAAAGPILIVLPAVFASAWPVVVLSGAVAVVRLGARLAGALQSVHGIRRASAGAFLYPVAIALSFVLAQGHPDWYAIAIAALAFGDAASGLVGAHLGRRWYAAWGDPKSVEGSLAIFSVTAMAAAAILLLFGASPAWALLVAAFTGLVVALVESALPWGLDNVGVPVAALAALAVADSPIRAGIVLLAAVALCRYATTRASLPVVALRRRSAGETARAVTEDPG